MSYIPIRTSLQPATATLLQPQIPHSVISKNSLDPNYAAHLTVSYLLSASRYLPTWLIPYMLLASVSGRTRMTKTILIPHLTPTLAACLPACLPAQHFPFVTPPVPAFPADRIMEDTAAQPSCTEDPSLEKAVVSADPDPPGVWRSSRTRRRPARFEDYDTELQPFLLNGVFKSV